MMDYNSNEDSRMTNKTNELFLKTKNDLQNNVQTKEIRREQSIAPKIRVEESTMVTNKNMTKNHPGDHIIGSKDKGVMTRSKINEELCLISQVEPKNIDEAIKDHHWIQAMKEELDQIMKNDTWELVPRP